MKLSATQCPSNTSNASKLLMPAPLRHRPAPFVVNARQAGLWAQHCRRASPALRAVGEDAGADGIVFGRPMAPKELYESIARTARQGLMAEVAAMDSDAPPSASSPVQGDVVMAALHLASEDDAIKTRTHIPLPVDAFSTRLDNLAAEVRVMLPADLPPIEQLSFITHYVFNRWGLKVAKSMEDGLYSPYRVYMHQVLAQRCGTQVAVAAILHSLFARLYKSGVISWQAMVGLPSDVTAQPTTALLEPNGKVVGVGVAGGVGVRWVSGRELVAELLDQLKRAYWSWDWPLGAASGFDACARGLTGSTGRAGRFNAAVGVMQARGRPFGDVTLAILSSERLCLVTRFMGQDQWVHQLQVRDFATQLLHVGRRQEGLEQLEQYLAWVEQDVSRAGAAVSAVDLTRAVVLEEKRRGLEGALSKTAE